jgi:hypothetical protein
MVLRQLTKDWQLSGVLTASSGGAYTLGYSYNSAGANVNITGSPDWGGRVILATTWAADVRATRSTSSPRRP